MNRRKLLAHLAQNSCVLLREGAKHSIYLSEASKRTSSVPRHNEISDFLAAKICPDLGIDEPK